MRQGSMGHLAGWLTISILAAGMSACSNSDNDDGGGGNNPPITDGDSIFMNIVPAGSNGNAAGGVGAPVPGVPALSFPDNYRDQLDLYGNLAYAQMGLKSDSCVPPNSIDQHQASSDQACNYFKPAGLRPVEGTVVSSRELTAPNGSKVTIERDQWGVPYVLGDDRSAAQFGLGFASAQDRLWLWDLLRDVGRGEASKKLGPSETTFDLDLEFGVPGGYNEQELTAIVNTAVAKIGDLGPIFLNDTEMFVAGMNAYVAYLQTPEGLAEVPPEYATLGLKIPPLFPPRPFTVNDIVANAVLIQSALGLGGGGEASNLQLLQKLDASFGPGSTSIPEAACEFWRDIRHADDPETTHSTNRRFATQSPPSVSENCPQNLPAGVAIWDVDSLVGREFLRRDSGAPLPLIDLGGVPFLGDLLGQITGALTGGAPDLEAPVGGGGGLVQLQQEEWHPPLKPAKGVEAQSLMASVDPNSIHHTLEQYGLPRTTSNWIAVSADQTQSGVPIMVGGPQTGYFQPQLLWEAAVVSTGGTEFDIAARGITTVNVPYITIGRGRDFAWSPTSASSDFTDIRVSMMCNTDGSPASRDDGDDDGFPDADGYMFDGECVKFYRRTDTWDAVPTPASIALGGSPTAEAISRFIMRTHYGPVVATATVNGAPVAVSTQRSTFMADVDATIPFATMVNNGEDMDHRRFRELFNSMTSTFNWVYADGSDIAFIQSGLYPRRHPQQHPELPVWGDGNYEWEVDQNLGPAFFTSYGGDAEDGAVTFPTRAVPVEADSVSGRPGYFEWPGYLSLDAHVQDVNPPSGFLANWNNNGAPGWWAADTKSDYGPVHRVNHLSERLQAFKASGRKHDLASMIEIMGDAAYTDLRGLDVVPLLVEVLETDTLTADQQSIVDLLEAWMGDGSQQWINGGNGLGSLRRDRDQDGAYDHRAAVVFIDAWFQHLNETLLPQLAAVGGPVIQGRLDAPGPVGSAFQGGWFQFMYRVLRTALNKSGRTDYKVLRCADSDALADCRAAVVSAMDMALSDLGGLGNQAAWDGTQIYGGTTVEDHDAVEATSFAFLPTPPIHWINRPTFQQAVEIHE